MCLSDYKFRLIKTDIFKSVIINWEEKGLVYPYPVTENEFTTGGLDNIDYNPTSTTASPDSVLHGTSISILHYNPVSHANQIEIPS